MDPPEDDHNKWLNENLEPEEMTGDFPWKKFINRKDHILDSDQSTVDIWKAFNNRSLFEKQSEISNTNKEMVLLLKSINNASQNAEAFLDIMLNMGSTRNFTRSEWEEYNYYNYMKNKEEDRYRHLKNREKGMIMKIRMLRDDL